MKKLNFLLGIGIVSAAMLVTSCNKEDASAPSISFDATDPIQLEPGNSTAIITGEIVSDSKLDAVKIFTVIDQTETQIGSDITSFGSGEITETAIDNNYTFRFVVNNITENQGFKIEATNKDNKTSAKTINIILEPVTEFTAILMGGQSNLTYGSYLDAEEGDVYLQAAAEASSGLIDVVYYHGFTNAATITAPDDPTVNGGGDNLSLCINFTTKNSTKFSSDITTNITAVEFDAITSSVELDGLTGMNQSKVNALAAGDVLAFETVDGKKGLIKVISITSGVAGSITIDVKIQP